MTKRLHTFNGNYGLFRGLLAAELLILVIALFRQTQINPQFDNSSVFIVLGIAIALTIYRMDRFSKYYARELFAQVCIAAQAQDKQTDSTKTE
jgi:hypothetical protein